MTDAGRDVAMQVAAMAPVAIDKEDVDQKLIDREMEIAKEQIRAEGKPENMIEKIAQGKINKFYVEYTLLNQQFIKDEKKTIRQYLEGIDKNLQDYCNEKSKTRINIRRERKSSFFFVLRLLPQGTEL